jgi:hypothetical protein
MTYVLASRALCSEDTVSLNAPVPKLRVFDTLRHFLVFRFPISVMLADLWSRRHLRLS